MARPNTSRPQANSWLIGCTKKPSAERGPKPSMPIAQPQRMMTAGVRQLEERETGPSSPTCDMEFLICRWRIRKTGSREFSRLMQMHENPKSKMIASYEGTPAAHCVSPGPRRTGVARLDENVCGET